MNAPSLLLSTLLCSLEQHSLLNAHLTRMKKKCFQLNLLSALGFNPFSHSTYLWRESIIFLPSVGSILLPVPTQGTTWRVSFNKFTNKKLLLLVNSILLVLPEMFRLFILNWALKQIF